VCDFRSADIARGGQGAPLAPAFHQWAFGHASEVRAVINIGGISNITALSPGQSPVGFDSGPGNAMMDLLMVRHFDQAYDRDGIVASQGNVNAALLASLQDEAYFAKPPPKSTGRDWLNATWLDAKLRAHRAVSTLDQVTTLTEFTAWSIADAIKRFTPNVQRAFVCGGGAYNAFLLQRIRALSGIEVLTTDDLGVPAQQVEAVAFAWLAKLCVERTPLDLRSITGAKTTGILGCVYPAVRS
jgi:anhydro-N-acetylmuramic acid kinase